MAGPAVVVVASLATAYIAVATEDGLVVDDYYRQGLAVNKTLAREERARQLGLVARLQLTPQRDGVRLTLGGSGLGQQALRLTLAHPTRAGHDQTVLLQRQLDGSFGAALKPLGSNAWHAVLEGRTWRIAGVLPAHADNLVLRAQGN